MPSGSNKTSQFDGYETNRGDCKTKVCTDCPLTGFSFEQIRQVKQIIRKLLAETADARGRTGRIPAHALDARVWHLVPGSKENPEIGIAAVNAFVLKQDGDCVAPEQPEPTEEELLIAKWSDFNFDKGE